MTYLSKASVSRTIPGAVSKKVVCGLAFGPALAPDSDDIRPQPGLAASVHTNEMRFEEPDNGTGQSAGGWCQWVSSSPMWTTRGRASWFRWDWPVQLEEPSGRVGCHRAVSWGLVPVGLEWSDADDS